MAHTTALHRRHPSSSAPIQLLSDLPDLSPVRFEMLERRVLMHVDGDWSYFDPELNAFVWPATGQVIPIDEHSGTGATRDDGDGLATDALLDPSVGGAWSAVTNIGGTSIHASLLPTGKVFWWDFWTAREMDGTSLAITATNNAGYTIFCSGHSFLPDGRLLVAGGQGDLGDGLVYTSIYDPVTHTWTREDDMYQRRWYPTNTTLPDGDVLVLSGRYIREFDTNGNPVYDVADMPQIFDAQTSSWRDLSTALRKQWLYPFMFLAPDGRVFDAGPNRTSFWLDPSGTGSWTAGPQMNYGNRDYGTAVMYRPGKILIAGGSRNIDGEAPTNTAEIIDLNSPSPTWQYTDSMQFGRRQTTATILADGTVLVTGGSTGAGFNTAASGGVDVSAYAAELWNPDTGEWTTLAEMSVRRLYHSTAILLPDGRVLSAGGGHPYGTGQIGGVDADFNHNDAEIYSPPYLFKGPRPTITSAPSQITFGGQFTISTPEAANITKVTLVRLGSMTHDFNMEQRADVLSFTAGSGTLTINAPTDPRQMPPGPYMLFVVNDQGVPSVAAMMNLGTTAAPTIGSLSDSPDPAALGAASISLLADSVADTDGAVALVEFFRETNGTAGLQTGAGGDLLVGSDNNATGGWTTNASISGLSVGTYTYYAVARDNTGVASNIVSTTNAITDQTAPTASLAPVSDVTTAGGTTKDFTVTFSDNLAIDVSTIDAGDVTVTDPSGSALSVSLVSVSSGTDGTPRSATYRMTAPGGSWDLSDNGAYAIAMVSSQVTDTSGNAVAGGSLAGFSVSIPQPPPTIDLPAVADAYVRGGTFASQNFGQSVELHAGKGRNASDAREVYLKFDLSSVSTIGSAVLRLHGRASASGSLKLNVYDAASTSWSEDGITYNNRPAAGRKARASLTVSGTTGAWYQVDLTTFLRQLKSQGASVVTFVLTGAKNTTPYAIFDSAEAAANQPELVIDQTAPLTTGPGNKNAGVTVATNEQTASSLFADNPIADEDDDLLSGLTIATR